MKPCVKGTIILTSLASYITLLSMRVFINCNKSPPVSSNPAMSTHAISLFSSGSTNIVGMNVSDTLLEWPILKPRNWYSGLISMTYWAIIMLESNVPCFFYVAKRSASGPKIKLLKIVDLPQPVAPMQSTILRSFNWSRCLKAGFRTLTRFSRVISFLEMIDLLNLSSLKSIIY